jgi:hypothetical protein
MTTISTSYENYIALKKLINCQSSASSQEKAKLGKSIFGIDKPFHITPDRVIRQTVFEKNGWDWDDPPSHLEFLKK